MFLYDKRDDVNFCITSVPFLSSNTPLSTTYGVFSSQVIRYGKACSSHEYFNLIAMRFFKYASQVYDMDR